MKEKLHSTAYIDGSNLYHSVKGKDFDYGKFRVWLKDKFNVDRAYIFLGLIDKNREIYKKLEKSGYLLIFRKILTNKEGQIKANCDSDLIVKATMDVYETKENFGVLLVSSDGDFVPFVEFCKLKNKVIKIISPYETEKCSVLLKRTGVPIFYIKDHENKFRGQNKKAPDEDETS